MHAEQFIEHVQAGLGSLEALSALCAKDPAPAGPPSYRSTLRLDARVHVEVARPFLFEVPALINLDVDLSQNTAMVNAYKKELTYIEANKARFLHFVARVEFDLDRTP